MRSESLFPPDLLSRRWYERFHVSGEARITVSLDDKLVEKLRKVAVEQHTTLSGLMREHLGKIAAEDAATSDRSGVNMLQSKGASRRSGSASESG